MRITKDSRQPVIADVARLASDLCGSDYDIAIRVKCLTFAKCGAGRAYASFFAMARVS